MQPMRSWSTPPWLAGSDDETIPPEGADAERASLEDVALRMEKIKQSAAAVRDSVERRPSTQVHRSSGTQLAPDANVPSPPAPFPSESRPSPTDPILAEVETAERETLVLDPQRGAQARAAAEDFSNLDPSKPLDQEVLSDEVLVDHAARPPVGAEPPRSHSAAGFEDQFLGDLDAVGDDDDDGFGDDGYGDDEFGDDGYGDDEFGDDEFGDDEFGSMTAASAPMPWKAILAGAGVLVVVGLVLFNDAIFGGGDDDGAPATTDQAEGGSGDAPEGKADGAAAAAADGGKPVTPDTPAADGKAPPLADGKAPPPVDGKAPPPADGKAPPPADGKAPPPADGTTPPPADGTAPPAGTPPVAAPPAGPMDAAALAKLDEARGLWQAAKGRNKGKLKRSRAILEELLTTAGEHPETLLVMAQVQLELGATKDALATAKKCTQASAELADCWLTTGFLEQDAKNKAGAKEAYEKYLQLAPDGKYAGDVKKLLAGLK